MTRRRLFRILLAAILCAIGVTVIGFFWAVRGGPTKGVDPIAWSQLKVGMSKAEVAALLGNSWAKTKTGVSSEWWEYNYQSGFDGPPSSRAYVVYFDDIGRLVKWREPLHK
jgi:outer membrane protein assembly factor BamE (lipoprotein component of BamABCDE complex)